MEEIKDRRCTFCGKDAHYELNNMHVCDKCYAICWEHEHENSDNEQAKYTELLTEWLNLNDSDCRLDHHGNCQEHFLQQDCIVKRTREFFETTWKPREVESELQRNMNKNDAYNIIDKLTDILGIVIDARDRGEISHSDSEIIFDSLQHTLKVVKSFSGIESTLED